MKNSRQDGQAQDGSLPEKLEGAMDRRAFLSTSALLGLGFAAGCTGMERDLTGVVAGPSTLQAVPGGSQAALDIFNSSGVAKDLAAWLQSHNLRQEPGRALLFDVPAVQDLPAGVTAEDRPSLIGESAYKTFQNDSFATSQFTRDQMASISTVARAEMASEIGSLLQHGSAVLAIACCCCCSCCSLCCCSCNRGNQHHSSSFQVAAVPYGDPTVVYAGGVRNYFRGMVGVQDDGEAVAVLESVSNDPAMTVHEIAIGLLDKQTRAVRAYRFTPQQLDQMGPQALAQQLFSTTAA